MGCLGKTIFEDSIYFTIVKCASFLLCLFVLLLQYDWTALHFAADNNHPEIIKILVSNGADISAVNKV